MFVALIYLTYNKTTSYIIMQHFYFFFYKQHMSYIVNTLYGNYKHSNT